MTGLLTPCVTGGAGDGSGCGRDGSCRTRAPDAVPGKNRCGPIAAGQPLSGGMRGIGRALEGFMNSDTLKGEGRDIGGKIKETAGDLTGNADLQAEGLGDQIAGKVQKAAGTLRDAVTDTSTPLIERGKEFARRRPFAALALAGVIGVALLNTLRGKRT